MEVVKYIGTAHRRIITARDWQEAGLDGETFEWSFRNGFSVPVDQFTEDQLADAIRPDPTFVIIGGEDADVKPRALSQNMTGQQAAESPRIDMMGAVGTGNGSNGSSAASGSSEQPSGSGPTLGGGGTKPTKATRGTGSGSD